MLLLRVVAEGDQHRADHVDAEGDDRWRAFFGQDFLMDEAVDRIPAAAAMGRRPVGCDPAFLVQLAVPAEVILLAEALVIEHPLAHGRIQLGLDEGAHLVGERALFV